MNENKPPLVSQRTLLLVLVATIIGATTCAGMWSSSGVPLLSLSGGAAAFLTSLKTLHDLVA